MRNYYKEPLKAKEYPTFEDIYHYYIERNCMTIFNVITKRNPPSLDRGGIWF